MTTLAEFFSDASPLAELLPGFQPRPGQAWMAEAVAEALSRGEKLVVEAGTGTGKTFAYLLPALESGRRTIISTGTKALQDQLYHRDLPLLGKAIGRPVRTALLKGRANYLCLHRLEQVTDPARALAADLNAVQRWRHRTVSGDRAELTEVAEDSPIWPLVTSTAENCLGQKCRQYADCHVVAARRAAQEADLVVINHHLLLADLAMKEQGFVEFLPGAEAIVIDEAHQVPDLAVQFFGVSIGSRDLERMLEEIRAHALGAAGAEFMRRLDKAQTAIKKLRSEAPRSEGRYALEDVLADLRLPLDNLVSALIDLQGVLAETSEAAAELEQQHRVISDAIEKLRLLCSDDSWDGLRWLKINPRSLRFNLTPLDVSGILRPVIETAAQAWVFTSATLAVGEDFSHFTSRLGLIDAHTLAFPSPYDIEHQGLVYLPAGMPQPSSQEHTEAVLDAVMPLLDLTAGGMFCLFTSHRALNAAELWLSANGAVLRGRQLLVQGQAPRDDLLRRFRSCGDAVLLGTGSFWEGVDVRGSALTVVAIDKLPFTSPSDPLLMARLEYIRREGGNGFTEHQLPQAILALKQGVGRLLRDQADYGVVVLCDPRVREKSYGRLFFRAFESMPVTSSLSDVAHFFTRHESAGAVA